MDRISLTAVCERDIDLLLIEELMSSQEFLSWLLTGVGLSGNGRLVGIKHSVSTPTGESDIELDLQYPEGMAKVLLENKIDAPFQHEQAERYRRRAATYTKDDKYHVVSTVLVAPQDYSSPGEVLGFDKRISYESILDWFTNAQDLGNRKVYKRSLLLSAIERGSSGWTMVPDDQTTSFWHQYWLTAAKYAGELQMPEPTRKPATSSFMFFQPAALGPSVKLIHKVPYGNVDLQFKGFGDRLPELEQRFGSVIEEGMQIVKAAGSGAVRMKVPELDLHGTYQEALVRQGLAAAIKLLRWFKGLPSQLR